MRWLTDLRFGSPGMVTFRDACGTVRDAGCRAARRRDGTLPRAARYGHGLPR